jgi:hypothetical protein
LAVTGKLEITGDLTVNGSLTAGEVDAGADFNVTSLLTATGNSTIKVAGTVTITGATLSGSTFTALNAEAATLTLAASAEIEVAAGGAVTIGANSQIALTDGTSKINLTPSGRLVASSETSDLIKASNDQTKVKLDATSGAGSNLLVTTTGGNVYTVKKFNDTGSEGNVILGKIKFAIPSSYTAAISGEATEQEAAGGTLVAGEGTKLTLDGSAT